MQTIEFDGKNIIAVIVPLGNRASLLIASTFNDYRNKFHSVLKILVFFIIEEPYIAVSM